MIGSVLVYAVLADAGTPAVLDKGLWEQYGLAGLGFVGLIAILVVITVCAERLYGKVFKPMQESRERISGFEATSAESLKQAASICTQGSEANAVTARALEESAKAVGEVLSELRDERRHFAEVRNPNRVPRRD